MNAELDAVNREVKRMARQLNDALAEVEAGSSRMLSYAEAYAAELDRLIRRKAALEESASVRKLPKV